jgi:hypothetical protein
MSVIFQIESFLCYDRRRPLSAGPDGIHGTLRTSGCRCRRVGLLPDGRRRSRAVAWATPRAVINHRRQHRTSFALEETIAEQHDGPATSAGPANRPLSVVISRPGKDYAERLIIPERRSFRARALAITGHDGTVRAETPTSSNRETQLSAVWTPAPCNTSSRLCIPVLSVQTKHTLDPLSPVVREVPTITVPAALTAKK